MNQPRLTCLVRADLRDFNFGSNNNPDSTVHGAHMGPTWVLSAPDGLHIGPMNLAMTESTAQPLAMSD